MIALLFDRKTPSEMARPTGTGFGKELADAELVIKAFAVLPEGAQSVKPLLAELEAAVGEGDVAFTALSEALDLADLASRKVPDVKDRAWKLLDRLEGQLKDRFPGQRKAVASFFMPSDIPRKRAEPADPGVDPGGESDDDE